MGREEIKKRVMGLDFGSKTCGVAVSDPLRITAQGIGILRREKENHLRSTLRKIQELAGEYDVGAIVLGYPKNMNNTEGDRAAVTRTFQKTLEMRLALPVFLWDERLTTAEAERLMADADLNRDRRKANVDKLAAVLILQGWLDNENAKNKMHREENG